MNKNIKKAYRLLIFDSGIGGLSIYKEAKIKFPYLEIHYLSDNDSFPYGNKSINFLSDRIPNLLKIAEKKIKPDMIVIGCNTVSTLLLDKLRVLITVPIIGVVPAIKTASLMTKTKTFALLATDETIKRRYTDNLIKKYARDCNIIRLGASDLVANIESHINGGNLDRNLIRLKIEELKEKSNFIDIIVLGCTHFSMIQKDMKKINPKIQFIDSTAAIISRIESKLTTKETNVKLNTTMWITKNVNISPLNKHLKEYSFFSFKKLI